MLSDNFRFTIENNTGVTIDASKIVIKYRGKYYSPSTGKLTFEAESVDVANQGSSIASGAFHHGSTIDNGNKLDPIMEADVTVALNFSTNGLTPNGYITLHLQRATADTPVFTDDGYARDHTVITSVPTTAKVDKSITVTVS